MRKVTFILPIMFIFLFLFSSPLQARKYSVCGVSLGRSRSCYREVRKLRKACRLHPVLLGNDYRTKPLPPLAVIKKSYIQLRRTNRRRWIKSLCGIPLYSHPKTFCGIKGVEVAYSCLQKSLPPQPRTASLAQAPSTPSSSPKTTTTTKSSPKNNASSTTSQTLIKIKKRSPHSGTAKSSSSSSWGWNILQIFTLLLVIFLFFQFKEGKQRRVWEDMDEDWKAKSQWDQPSVSLSSQEQKKETSSQEFQQFKNSIKADLAKMRQVIEQELAQFQDIHSPMADLQKSADRLFDYYKKLAQKFIELSGVANETSTQLWLLDAQKNLRFAFASHREPDTIDSSFSADLQQDLLNEIDKMLEDTSYINIEATLADGQFSAETYIERALLEQAALLIQGEKTKTFAEIQKDFLYHLEELYIFNFQQIQKVLKAPFNITEEEQKKLYQQRYIEQFLLKTFPQKLQAILRQSNPTHTGALLDQLLHFLWDELEKAGLEFFPEQPDSMKNDFVARVTYINEAGVRYRENNDIILRSPSGAIMATLSSQSNVEQPAVSSLTETTTHTDEASHPTSTSNPSNTASFEIPTKNDDTFLEDEFFSEQKELETVGDYEHSKTIPTTSTTTHRQTHTKEFSSHSPEMHDEELPSLENNTPHPDKTTQEYSIDKKDE